MWTVSGDNLRVFRLALADIKSKGVTFTEDSFFYLEDGDNPLTSTLVLQDKAGKQRAFSVMCNSQQIQKAFADDEKND